MIKNRINPYELWPQPIRLPNSVLIEGLHRVAYIHLPTELYAEDIDFIKKQLDAIYVESRPSHTPNHDMPCPACLHIGSCR